MIFSLSKKQKVILYSLTIIIALGVSLQSYFHPPKSFAGIDGYTAYNNYVIFKNSFFHLKENTNLYIAYEAEHWDLYKYSPTFSLLMMPFWYLDNFTGLFLWNLLNMLVFVFAMSKIDLQNGKKFILAMLFLLPEMLTSAQNSQSNLLIAGLMILGFTAVNKNKIAEACLYLLIAAFIKPFALVGFVIFLLFPGKLQMIKWSLVFTIILFLLPLIMIPFSALMDQYHNWSILLQNDHDVSYGYSILGILNSWFHLDPSKFFTLLVGIILLFLPYLQIKKYRNYEFKNLLFSSILIWVIIFNHKSESPTFIIAAAGIAIWYFTQVKRSLVNDILMILAFIFTCLIATDLFPLFIRKEYAEPYAIKVVPCILIWVKIQIDSFKKTPTNV